MVSSKYNISNLLCYEEAMIRYVRYIRYNRGNKTGKKTLLTARDVFVLTAIDQLLFKGVSINTNADIQYMKMIFFFNI